MTSLFLAQNVQNNKQMDPPPHPPPCPVWTPRWYEVEDLEQMSTASPMVQAKTHGFLRDNTYPIQIHRTIKNE